MPYVTAQKSRLAYRSIKIMAKRRGNSPSKQSRMKSIWLLKGRVTVQNWFFTTSSWYLTKRNRGKSHDKNLEQIVSVVTRSISRTKHHPDQSGDRRRGVF